MKITPEMIEAVAKAIRRTMVRNSQTEDGDFIAVEWDHLPEMAREQYRSMAESALKATPPE